MSIRFVRSLLATLALTLAVGTSTVAHSAAVGGEVLKLLEVSGSAAKQQVEETIRIGLQVLTGEKVPTPAGLSKALAGSAEDKELLRMLTAPASKAEAADAINRLAKRAEGMSSAYRICKMCTVETELAKKGITNILQPTPASVREALKDVPKGPKLVNSVRDMAKKAGASIDDQVYNDAELLKEIYTVFKLTNDGSEGQKKLGKAILAMNAESKGSLVVVTQAGKKRIHPLYSLMSEDFSEAESLKLAEQMEIIAKDPLNASRKARTEALEKWLDSKSSEVGLSKEEMTSMKSRLCNCYALFCAR